MHAPQEHLARLAPHAVVVAAGKIAMNQIPHGRASSNTSVGLLTLWQRICRIVSTLSTSAVSAETLGFCRRNLMSWIESAKLACSTLIHARNRRVQFRNDRRSEGRWLNS